MAANGASRCEIESDPGGIRRAPFYCEPDTGNRAFLPMDDFSFASRDCPALGSYGGLGRVPGCASAPAPCLGPSPSMVDFFGPRSRGPAVWATRPDLSVPPLSVAPTR